MEGPTGNYAKWDVKHHMISLTCETTTKTHTLSSSIEDRLVVARGGVGVAEMGPAMATMSLPGSRARDASRCPSPTSWQHPHPPAFPLLSPHTLSAAQSWASPLPVQGTPFPPAPLFTSCVLFPEQWTPQASLSERGILAAQFQWCIVHVSPLSPPTLPYTTSHYADTDVFCHQPHMALSTGNVASVPAERNFAAYLNRMKLKWLQRLHS